MTTIHNDRAVPPTHTDILIVGCGVSGLYCALNLPADKRVTIITKSTAEESDSFLAQGGICVLRDSDDYASFYEDTMRAGHYENNPVSVDIMIRESRRVIDDLVSLGTDFARDEEADPTAPGGDFRYTREGAHSRPRILYHKDETGREITSRLLAAARARKNITLLEQYTMVDLLTERNTCYGIVGQDRDGAYSTITADYTVLATGGIGGLYRHSTNFPHLTGDALAVSLSHGVKLKNINYIQIHPTTLFSHGNERKFLISESVRGEGAVLLNSRGERFTDELRPRDVVAEAIRAEMEKEGSEHVWLSLAAIPREEILTHFPNIYRHCLDAGYDITREPIPVVPAQHYFMGGVAVDSDSQTSMERLFAVGETACNGVHGRNRLASNSLLESLVFAGRAAARIAEDYRPADPTMTPAPIDPARYEAVAETYKAAVLAAIEKETQAHG